MPLQTSESNDRGRSRVVVLTVLALASIVIAVPFPNHPTSAAIGDYLALVPGRVLETREGYSTTDGQFAGIGMRRAGEITLLTVAGRAGVPEDASAVVLNFAVTGSFTAGYATVWPCGEERPIASSINHSAGQTVSNAVTAKVGAAGQICIFTLSATHVIVDVTGAYPASATFAPLVPSRLLETREGQGTVDGQFAGIGMPAAGGVIELTVANRGGAGDASAVVLNVAVTGSFFPGYLTLFPCGEQRPNAASLNHGAGQTISNAVTAKVGAGGKVCIFSLSATHIIVDITGAFPANAGYNALVPGRILETREGLDTADGQYNAIGLRTPGRTTEIVVAGRAGVGSVDAVVLNVAVTGAHSGGYLTLYPCDEPKPNAASLNFATGETISNAVTAKVGAGGTICLFAFAPTHVIIDVTGYFAGSIAPPPPSTAPRSTTTTTTTAPPATKPMFQAVVAVPSTGRTIAGVNVESAIAQEVQAVLDWYDTQTGGRHPDFVRAGGSVSVLIGSLSMTRDQVAAQGGYERAAQQIRDQLPANRYPVIFYDGAVREGFCGVESSLDWVFIPMGNCGYPKLQGFPFGTTLVTAHEVAHALGAEGSCGASYQGGHELRSPQDVMYVGARAPGTQIVLDVPPRDYYQPTTPGCPDMSKSPLLS